MRRFKAGSLDIHGTSSIANQRAFGIVEVAIVEEVPPGGGGVIHEELGETTEPDVMFGDDEEDWDFDGIITFGKVEASDLQGRMCALRKNCCSASGKVLADILTVVALAERTLPLDRQVTNQEWALVEVEQSCKFRVAQTCQLSIAI